MIIDIGNKICHISDKDNRSETRVNLAMATRLLGTPIPLHATLIDFSLLASSQPASYPNQINSRTGLWASYSTFAETRSPHTYLPQQLSVLWLISLQLANLPACAGYVHDLSSQPNYLILQRIAKHSIFHSTLWLGVITDHQFLFL